MIFHNANDERIYLARVQRQLERLWRRYVADSRPLEAELAVVAGRPAFAERPCEGYRAVGEGEVWGSDWQTGWFRLRGTVPSEWAGAMVQLWIDLEGEGLLYRPDGSAVQGITHGSIFAQQVARPFVPISQQAQGGEAIDFWLEAAANRYFGITPPGRCHTASDELYEVDDPRRFGSQVCTVKTLRLARCDTAVWDLAWDIEVLLDCQRGLDAGSVRRARLITALSACCDVLARDENDLAGARAVLAPALARPAAPGDIPVRAVGHAHIDTAWLWPLEETVRKTARTFATQLDLIDRYPGYVFGASSAQHYLWMKERHPDLYARIKTAVAAGRWEIQGGMWVEADCNIPSGESFVRQFLHGQRFFRDEFGFEVDNLWLPDVFGYSAALPQIMAQCGVTTFLTQKISWNQIDVFPFHTFWWQGLDGSRVLSHFPPEDTYNSELKPSALIAAQQRFREKAVVDEVMSLFGVGDGGGGPRPQDLERATRLHDLEGCPPVRFGRASDFFATLAAAGDQLKSWVGELYLEFHRGTYTTQGRVKWLNRQVERRLRELELLWSNDPAGYPQATFDACWKMVLLHQFHDIIPGSSIHAVYEDTHQQLEEVLTSLQGLHDDFAARHLAAAPQSLSLHNSLPQPWSGVIELPPAFAGRGAVDAAGQSLPTQQEEGRCLALVTLSGLDWLSLRPAGEAAAVVSLPEPVLENELVRYVFAEDGRLLSAYDKRCRRELLRAPGNLLRLHQDRPHDHDAWDIDRFYREELIGVVALRIVTQEGGPVRQRLVMEGAISEHSSLRLEVSLAADSARLDFTAEVDWFEQHRMLRVAFPAAVHTQEATCDVQFGHLRRPTHQNTSWDMARFEVCCHRYADLSQPDCGLALLNDCKYGYSVHDNVLDLNLLRSPTAPDPDADRGHHRFTYALLPHAGDHLQGRVLEEATALNQPPLQFVDRAVGPVALRLEGEGVERAALKRAEDDHDLVVRLVERRGCNTPLTLTLPVAASLQPCNLLERPEGEALPVAISHALELRPFEIRSFLIR
jgi:alpha-mannosidase